MTKSIIEVKNLSKRYNLGQIQGYKTFRESLQNVFKHRKVKENVDYIWALRDLSFDVHEGDVLGIIGHNGAGKTTLLKVLSRITDPTEGLIKLRGRVASLLEVGTGFHQELTGRENIFLNGAILGMKRNEIQRKFDEIVSFAEIEKFIDTPVKRYSSGMYVRLAFAVAAHLEPEILLVDEVLAVGDIAFQKKCLGKMRQVGRIGRTVLFISHNMQAVASLCSKAILLQSGRIIRDGRSQTVIQDYLGFQNRESKCEAKWGPDDAPGNDVLRLFFVRVLNRCQEKTSEFLTNEDITLEYCLQIGSVPDGLRIGFDLVTQEGITAFRSFHNDSYNGFRGRLKIGQNILRCIIPGNLLNEGKYDVHVRIGIHMIRWIVLVDRAITFHTVRADETRGWFSGSQLGVIAPVLRWHCRTP